MSNYDNAFISNLIEEEVGEGRQLQLQVVGDSMVPIIKHGDIACVERKSAQELRQGDVIVLHLREGFLMHRLIINDGKQFLLKGDNCVLADPPVDLNSAFGEVVAVERNGITTYSKNRNWIMVNTIIGWLSYQNLKLVSFCEYLELNVLKRKSTSITSIIRHMLLFPFKVFIRILILQS